MQSIKVGLEWFLNPDHLPFIAGIENGWFEQQGLNVSLIEPEDHYDGLAAVVSGELQFACNEPLHMVDAIRPGLKALGCFFATDGGVMLTPEGEQILAQGGSIAIASPVAGDVTDPLAHIILERWCANKAIAFKPEQATIHTAGFEHVKNMQNGYHGAWLCFANFEGVEAKQQGLEATFISATDVKLPNFSALELFTGENFLNQHQETVTAFSDVVSKGATWCQANPRDAAKLWYKHTQEAPSALMDAIIDDTCKRLVSPLKRDNKRWHSMWQSFNELGFSKVNEASFNDLYL